MAAEEGGGSVFQHLEEMALSELRGDCEQASKGECLAQYLKGHPRE